MKSSLCLLVLFAAASSATHCKWGPAYWCQSKATATQCGQLSYCQTSVWKVSKPVEQVTEQQPNRTECGLCRLLVILIHVTLKSNETKNESRNLALKDCKALGMYAKECKEFVIQHFSQIWLLVENEPGESPHHICKEAGICTGLRKQPKPHKCEICRLVVILVVESIYINKTENQTKNAILQDCGSLGNYTQECKEFTMKYFSQIWMLVKNETGESPHHICKEAGICTGLWKAQDPQFDKCDVCKVVVDLADKFIDANKTEEEAKELVLQACDYLGSLAQECHDMVDQFFPEIWQFIENEMKPDEICQEIGLCTSLKKVAKKTQVSEPESVQCDVCVFVVKLIDQYVEQNKTKEEVKAEIEKFCSALGSLEEECKTVVDMFFDEIWDLIEEELDPTTICTEIGLCKSLKLALKMLKEVSISKPESVQCDVCVFVVKLIDQYVEQNKTKEEVKAEIEKFCSALGSLEAECKTVVDMFFDEIWDLIEKELDPTQICTEIGLCKSLKLALKMLKEISISKPESVQCDVCKLIVTLVQKEVEQNKTEAEVKQLVEDLCDDLGSLKDECLLLVDTYFDQIWNLITSELDPTQVCTEIGLCSKSLKLPRKPALKDEECDLCKDLTEFLQIYVDNNATEEEVKEVIELICEYVPIFADQCKVILDNFDQYWKFLQEEVDGDHICYQLGICTKIETVKPKKEKQDVCQLCELVVSFIQPFVDSDVAEEEVEQALESLCDLLPGDIGTECDNLVKQYFPVIWGLVKSEVDNDLICKQLGLCPSTQIRKAKVTAPKVDVKCDFCKLMVKVLKPFIDRNASEGELKSIVGKLCEILPSTYKTECLNFLKEDFDLFWMILKQETDDGELCYLIEFCSNSSAPAVPKVAMAKQDAKAKSPEFPFLCQICEFLVEKVESMLVNNATKEEILGELVKLCGDLPSSWKNECVSFVDDYGEKIIDLLMGGMAAKAVCTFVGACQLATTKTKTFTFTSEPELDLCGVCEVVLEFVKDIIGENATEDAVVDALDKVCSLFPSALQDECTDFVNQYGKEVVQLIVKGMEPKKICEDIDLCPKTRHSAMVSPWKMIERAFPRV